MTEYIFFKYLKFFNTSQKQRNVYWPRRGTSSVHRVLIITTALMLEKDGTDTRLDKYRAVALRLLYLCGNTQRIQIPENDNNVVELHRPIAFEPISLVT